MNPRVRPSQRDDHGSARGAPRRIAIRVHWRLILTREAAPLGGTRRKRIAVDGGGGAAYGSSAAPSARAGQQQRCGQQPRAERWLGNGRPLLPAASAA